MRLFIFRKFLVLFLLFSLVITGFPAFSGNFVKAENLPLENIPEDLGGEVSPNLPDLPLLPLEPLPNPPLEEGLEEPQPDSSPETEFPNQSVTKPEDLSEPMGNEMTKLPLEAEDKTNLEGLNERLEQSPLPERTPMRGPREPYTWDDFDLELTADRSGYRIKGFRFQYQTKSLMNGGALSFPGSQYNGKDVTEIGYRAFTSKELTSVDFSELTALTTIREDAFSQNQLRSVNFSGLTALTVIDGSFYLNQLKTREQGM